MVSVDVKPHVSFRESCQPPGLRSLFYRVRERFLRGEGEQRSHTAHSQKLETQDQEVHFLAVCNKPIVKLQRYCNVKVVLSTIRYSVEFVSRTLIG